MSENEKLFTQEELNKLAGTVRDEGRKKGYADAKAEAAKDKEAAEQAALEAQQQWKTLAEQRGARVTELEPLVKQVEGYEELIKGLLKDAVEALGDAAKTAVNGLPKSMTAIEKLDWLHKNEGLFQPTGGGVGTPNRQTKSPVNVKSEPRRVQRL